MIRRGNSPLSETRTIRHRQISTHKSLSCSLDSLLAVLRHCSFGRHSLGADRQARSDIRTGDAPLALDTKAAAIMDELNFMVP